MKRADRRELAVLGLMALGWALVVSPLLHREEHQHGHAHSHGPAKSVPTDEHGASTLEHGSLALHAAPVAAAVVGVFTTCAQPQPAAPRAPQLVALRSVAQAQAPPAS